MAISLKVKKSPSIGIIGTIPKGGLEGHGSYVIPNENKAYIKYYNDISKYRINKYEADKNGDLWYKDYPLLEYSDGRDYQKWMFFGWYEDEQCTKAISLDKLDGAAYAIFYPISTTIIKGTVEPGVTMQSAKGYNRLYYRTPTMNLKKIGIYTTLPTGKSSETITTSVSNFQSFEENGYTYKITAEETDEAMASGKITSFKMNGVPQSYFPLAWCYKLLIVTEDGTKVFGINNVGRMQDYLEQYFNVPIYMNTDDTATDASFMVNYNTTYFTFNTIDTLGCLFENATVEEVEDGVLKITLKGDNVKLNGTLVSLRFKSNAIDKVPPISTFNVYEEKIYNNDKEIKANIEDAQYMKWVLQADIALNKYIW